MHFAYRIPGLRNWVQLYNDSYAEDEFSPIAYPRRSAMNPGIYLARIPGIPKLDLRAEGQYTDLPGLQATGYFYFNFRFKGGYTNNGNLIGSWVGRQARGINISSTYWIAPETTVQFTYRKLGVSPDFLGGGTLHDLGTKTSIRVSKSFRVDAGLQWERWTFPLLAPTSNSNVTTTIQLVYLPLLQAK
jgi:hypothetical protein